MIGIFLDTETSGLDFYSSRIFEIAFCLIDLSTRQRLCEYSSIVSHPKSVFEESDPTSLYINGFTFDMVSSGKSEGLVASDIKRIFHSFKIKRENAVFICQNPSFDRGFFNQLISSKEQEKLKWPYHWLDFASMFFAVEYEQNKTPWTIGFSKDKIAEHLKLPKEARPHRAINGVNHLIDCFLGLFSEKTQARTSLDKP
jgi:DNA polymerase-3 subunit epsilon/oligoribonuclease